MPDNTDGWFQRYRFCQPLGQGGMGIIYLAEDRSANNAPCVVKQLISKHSDPDEHDEAVRLFKREANMLRQFDHAGIVRFFDDHTTSDGKYFLVMDYVPGKNLESIVSTYGPFNSEATVEIAIQCCEVLEYLHDQDPPIIYRDLKPSNLMLTPDGRVVFIDFGIARSFAPKQSATRVVTAGYSPPEQYFGKPETRSDLYALGATLGHLLTGQRPKPLSVSAPRHINKQVLLTLDDLVRRMTAHNPQDRPMSAREVRYELYRIYNEIHPDFEVPEEAQAQYASSAPPVRRGVITDTSGWNNEFPEPQRAISPDSQRETREQVLKFVDDRRAGQRKAMETGHPTLLNKLRQWWQEKFKS
ncbi:MAG TPA: serine/threonine-protein kinase [Drouetiella sp.]